MYHIKLRITKLISKDCGSFLRATRRVTEDQIKKAALFETAFKLLDAVK